VTIPTDLLPGLPGDAQETMAIARPMIGSAIGMPAATTIADAMTPRTPRSA